MFSAIAITNTSVYVPTSSAGGMDNNYDTVAAAKKAMERHIQANKNTYAAGYDAYIIDRDKGTIVAVARIAPTPTVAWSDAPTDIPTTNRASIGL